MIKAFGFLRVMALSTFLFSFGQLSAHRYDHLSHYELVNLINAQQLQIKQLENSSTLNSWRYRAQGIVFGATLIVLAQYVFTK